MRIAESRKKSDFDNLAQKIEDAWYEVIGEKVPSEGLTEEDQKKAEKELKDRKQTDTETMAKKLQLIRFMPLITVRERGNVIPDVSSTLKFSVPFSVLFAFLLVVLYL